MISLSVGDEKSRISTDADIVYVEYLGVAPEHQRHPVGRRAIEGLGTVLLSAAVDQAFQLGLDGRVGLHSKDESLAFYRRYLTEFSRESTLDGAWIYFESSPDDAAALIDDGAADADS